MPTPSVDHRDLPYRIAVLCYLRDAEDRVLMLHRRKSPNAGLHSPIGGKLEVAQGEGPHDCALREIREEAGLELEPGHVRMCGIVSETAYEHQTHWLIFLFEVVRPIRHEEIAHVDFDEGTLEWVPADAVESLEIPDTDRRIMWPLVQANRGGFFVVHIDCRGDDLEWSVREGTMPSGATA